MITAIDTNILLDILIPDEAHSLSSKRLLDRCLEKGQLVICEVVYAELSSQFPSEGELRNFLSETGIRLIPLQPRSSIFSRRAMENVYEKKRTNDTMSLTAVKEYPSLALSAIRQLH